MNLKLSQWTKEAGDEFSLYLQGQIREEKIVWTRKIMKTQMPLLAIPIPQLRKIAKEIQKGNSLSFLDLALGNNFEEYVIRGMLFSQIKDFQLSKKYLLQYLRDVDNWALCDLLKFSLTQENTHLWWELSGELLQSDKEFERRMGVILMFQFLNEIYIAEIFSRLERLKEETKYYVNMASAWLLAECFVKQRTLTLTFLQFHRQKLNSFILNKCIQKCRESFRVSVEDKELLKTFKYI